MTAPIYWECFGPCLHREDDDDDDFSDEPKQFCLRGCRRVAQLMRPPFLPSWINRAFHLRNSGYTCKRYLFMDWEWPLYPTSLSRGEVGEVYSILGCEDKVSNRHAEILVDPSKGKAFLRDLGSALGTWLNGRKLYPFQPYQLTCGDVLSLGESVTENKLNTLGDKGNVFVYNVFHTQKMEQMPLPLVRADLSLRKCHVEQPCLPEVVVANVARYLDMDTLKSLRLVSRSWGAEATQEVRKRAPRLELTESCFREDRVKAQLRLDSKFVNTFGTPSQQRLFHRPSGARVNIQFSGYYNGAQSTSPRLQVERLWLYTDFMRGANIFLKSVSFKVEHMGLWWRQWAFVKALFEHHRETLEELEFDVMFHFREPPMPIPTDAILPRLKKAKVILKFLNASNGDVTQIGKDLVTLMPNLESLSFNTSSFPALFEVMALKRSLRKLTTLNIQYDESMDFLTLLTSAPTPNFLPGVAKMTLTLLLPNRQNPRMEMEHLSTLLLMASGSLEELVLEIQALSLERRNVVEIKFPRMSALKKLTLKILDDEWTRVFREWQSLDLKVIFNPVPTAADRNQQNGIPTVDLYSKCFPVLEELRIIQDAQEPRVEWSHFNWTRILESLFPTQTGNLDIRSSTLQWICLPGRNNFNLNYYDMTEQMLMKVFPNLRMIFD